MMPAEIRMTVSATELPQYRRLVDFLEAVAALADQRIDSELSELVDDARADFIELCS